MSAQTCKNYLFVYFMLVKANFVNNAKAPSAFLPCLAFLANISKGWKYDENYDMPGKGNGKVLAKAI